MAPSGWLTDSFLFQLQEVQTDLASMQSTTRYLKAQLRDNEEIMNRAIDAERRKARGELMRMKDAMLSILERERKAMRDEVMRQSAQVQAMIQNTTDTNTGSPMKTARKTKTTTA